MDRVPVVSIFGPTAVGKSAVGIQLREVLREQDIETVGISADAYAVYKEIPIITGATDLDASDWATVGNISLTEEWSAGAFASTAKPTIYAAIESAQIPVLVGGTGLYLQAALANLDLRKPVPTELRERVQRRLVEEGTEKIHAEVAKVLPERASRIEPTDSHRIGRALEAIELGQVDDSEQSLWTSQMRHPTLLFGLTMEREMLRGRISERVDLMLEAGAKEEVERAWKLGPSRTAAAAIGMRELTDGAIDEMKTRTHRLAKRQETWMRKLEQAILIDRTELTTEEVVARIVGELDNYLAS